MTLDSLTQAASENLLFTYFELGRAANGSKTWKEHGFHACVGQIEHPICNFAARLDLNNSAALRIARVALERPTFSVYVTPMDKPVNVGELLAREGFHRSYRLVQMVAEPGVAEPKVNLTRAATRYDRTQIALFMVDQFFNKQGQPFREQVADATAGALSLELLAIKKEGKILGASMVSFNGGMAGVYNFCVDQGFRGLGLGTSMIREILSVCSQKSIPATIQCDPKLEAWYKQVGFRRSGEIDVYALPKPAPFVGQRW